MAYITAGAAGMYCGSCMHDNTLARGLSRIGVDVQLIPTYTPIRTDEENVSIDRVFYGGINVFLEQKLVGYRFLSPLIGPFLDRPWLINWATRGSLAADPRTLGALTVSMLRGTAGYQRREAGRLCQWLSRTVRPHIVQFTNVLIAGCIPRLKTELGVPILVTLQGDDIFLESLVEPFRAQALQQIRKLARHVDGFLVHSRFYADFMSDYLGIPPSRIHLVPLGIDTSDFSRSARTDRGERPPTVGYLARIAPEKGLHLLVDAFLQLKQRPETSGVRLEVAGWLDSRHSAYFAEQLARIRGAGFEGDWSFAGGIDRRRKIEFLRKLDVFSVPTTYRDPKGLFVLEALAAGVPVVQPAHGAFPELLDRLGGGKLVPPGDSAALAEQLGELLTDLELSHGLGRAGQQTVLDQYHLEAMARVTWETLAQFLE